MVRKNASKFAAIQGLKNGGSSAEDEEGITRVRGKRSHQDYRYCTILIRKETHRKVSGRLLEEERSPDFSELVQSLLVTWLEENA